MNAVEKRKQALDLDLFVRVAQEKARRDQTRIIPFPSTERKEASSRVHLQQSQRRRIHPGAKTKKRRKAVFEAFSPKRTKGSY